MAEIDSPLGRKVFSASSGSSGGHRRVFTVEDPSDFPPEEFQTSQPNMARSLDPRLHDFSSFEEPDSKKKQTDSLLDKRREAAKAARNRLSPEAKRRIEILAGKTVLEDEVTLGGMKFKMCSLKGIAQEEVLNIALNSNEDSTPISSQYRVRRFTLASAITHIDDTPLEHIVGSNDPELKILIFEEFGDVFTDQLWAQYKEKIVDRFNKEIAIKDEKDAKEVVDSIKK